MSFDQKSCESHQNIDRFGQKNIKLDQKNKKLNQKNSKTDQKTGVTNYFS
jgi:hypothetical protein